MADKSKTGNSAPKGVGDEPTFDYDLLFPPKRSRTLGSKSIEISKMPVEVILRLDEIVSDKGRLGFSDQFDLAAMVIELNNPSITDGKEWMKVNGDGVVIIDFVRDVLAPIHASTGIPLPQRNL